MDLQEKTTEELIAEFVAKGGTIEKLKPQKAPKSKWYRDYHYASAMHRVGGVVPAGMVPFKRNVGKGE